MSKYRIVHVQNEYQRHDYYVGQVKGWLGWTPVTSRVSFEDARMRMVPMASNEQVLAHIINTLTKMIMAEINKHKTDKDIVTVIRQYDSKDYDDSTVS